MRVGVDVGGTFTDFVVITDGEMRVFKVPSTPSAPEQAVVDGLHVGGIGSAEAIVHGSTVATNALLERRGARSVSGDDGRLSRRARDRSPKPSGAL